MNPSYGKRPGHPHNRVPKQPDVVKLDDEHSQPVELWSPRPRKWWWTFHLVEENDKVWNGPFRTRVLAIQDAEAYCGGAG